jgi:hypothetical protein
MSIARPMIALVVCSSAAHAAALQPLIDRPVTLPRGAVDLTLHGTYTNWGNASLAAGSGSLSGETLAAGADFGTTDTAQLGIAAAFPIEPGAGFGSIVLGGAFAATRNAAMRVDAGFERVGLNGNTSGLVGNTHTSRFFGGLGARIQSPLSPTLAFVFGRRTGAVHLGHFNNLGDRGLGFYSGASALTEQSSDFLVVSDGDNGSGAAIGLNLPLGLLVQPDPHFALTLLAGYSMAIAIPSQGSVQTLHFIPVGLEAVVSPAAPVDVGLRFVLDGYVAETGGGGGGGPGYFDLRALMLWITVHG